MNCNCVNGIVELFKGPTMCSAICAAIIAFVLGMIVMCLVCKLFGHPCSKVACSGKKGGNAKATSGSGKKGPKEEKPFVKRQPHPAPADGSTEIYVGNLSYDMTEDQLRKEFEAFGKVSAVRLITNKFNGKSKGFGFVQMPERADAEKAIAALNEKEILGRKMTCNVAKNLV